MNKIIATAVAAVALGLSLSACDTAAPASTTAPASTSPAAAPAPATTEPAPADPDAVFLLTIREHDADFEVVPDENLTALAHSVCGALDRGASLVDVITAANNSDSGFDTYTNGYLIGASIAAYCPSYTPAS